ncbi:MAG: Ig domain-containing protein, partial [Candidatus Methanomethylophilaceae archaeon]|nr:Ig domain-containing protein [Candidatus Methanomethylophilaceae archaeon]
MKGAFGSPFDPHQTMQRRDTQKALLFTIATALIATLVFAFAPATDAAGDAVFEVESAEASAGSSVEVVINLTSNPGLWGVQADISYGNGLILTGIRSGNIMNVTVGPLDQNPYRLYCENNALSDTTATGALAVLTFQVSSSAAGTLSVSMDNFDAVNYAEEQVPCSSISGNVAIGTRVTGIALSEDTLTMKPGEQRTLTPIITPSNATNKKVTWTSTHESIATVNNGNVLAVDAGKTIIIATTEDGVFQATCLVTVQIDSIRVENVSINTDRISMKVGESATLVATVFPSDATDKNVTWSSSKTDVAIVTSNGKVTGISEGTAVITVTTHDGCKTDTCIVTISSESGEIPIEISSMDEAVLKVLGNANGDDRIDGSDREAIQALIASGAMVSDANRIADANNDWVLDQEDLDVV